MFKLLIECTKDIDSLSINFSDGTSVITESKQEIKNTRNDNIEIYDECKSAKSKESIKALDVPDVKDRPPKIDDTLNNLVI